MDVTPAKSVLKICGHTYFNEELSCLGSQFADILTAIKSYTESHDWYIFDVLGTSKQPFDALFPKDLRGVRVVHSTDELIVKGKKVMQFEADVFIAIQKEKKVEWNLDHLPETEQREGIQNPLADIEIRAFDYSFLKFIRRIVQ